MRKILNSKIFYFMLGAIIFGSIGVYASALISSSDVTYNNVTAKEALDDLYDKVNTMYTQTEYDQAINTGHTLRIVVAGGGMTSGSDNYRELHISAYLDGKQLNLRNGTFTGSGSLYNSHAGTYGVGRDWNVDTWKSISANVTMDVTVGTDQIVQ